MNPISLPQISSAAAGIPQGPNYAQMLSEAVANFPQQQMQAQAFKTQQDTEQQRIKNERLQADQAKLGMKVAEQKLEQEGQTTALSKLGLYYKMGVSDTTGARAKDPAFIKAVSDAAKAAGLGPLTIRDPATGAESVDMQALRDLVSSKLLSDLSPAEQHEIGAALPGAPRQAALERMGIPVGSVPKGVLEAPPESTFAQRTKVMEDFGKQLASMPTGAQNAQGISAQLRLWSPQLASAGVSVSDLREYLTSDAFVQSTLAPMAQAKMEQLRRLGVREDALAKWYAQRTVDEPKKLAADIEYRNGALQLRAERINLDRDLGYRRLDMRARELDQKTREIDVHVAQLQASNAKAAMGQGLALAKLQQTILSNKLKPLLDTRRQLQSELNDYILSSSGRADPPQELVTRISAIDQAVQKAQGTLEDSQKVLQSGTDSALSRMTGGQAHLRPGAIDPKNPPPGAEYSPSRKQWRVNGHLYDDRGNPVEH